MSTVVVLDAMDSRTSFPLVLVVALSACETQEAKPRPAAKRAEIEAVAKKTAAAVTFVADSSTADVAFEMQAPLEKQEGAVPAAAVSGQIDVDLTDLGKSTGLINVDIADLLIYQQRAEEEGGYGERQKSDLQNEHMRDWLEIGDDAPAADAEKNALVQFALHRIEQASVKNVATLEGAGRKVTFTGVGEFRLHQRVVAKKVKLEAVFHFDGDEPKSVDVRTVEPLRVDLAEHDVRPRTGFGKLAEKTLEMMAPKVGREAEVSVSLTLRPQT